MRIVVAIALVLGCAAMDLARGAWSAEKPSITLEHMQKLFADMKLQTPWNLDGPLLWGYFFTDPDPKKLEPVAGKLAGDGYRFVKIKPSKDMRTYYLHVEKVERHTPESLQQRNLEFYALAESYQLQSYDGMDVGPAP